MIRFRPIGMAIAAAALAFSAAAEASCIRMSPAEQRAAADVIFVGTALDGVTTTGLERFRVTYYIKGTGPKVVRIRTGRRVNADGTRMTTSVSIEARRGETWRIYARRLRPGAFDTNVCLGSRRLRR